MERLKELFEKIEELLFKIIPQVYAEND